MLLLGLAMGAAQAGEQVVVAEGTSMTWIANPSDPGLGFSWVAPDFDDSGWNAGVYGAGYEIGGAPNALELIQTEVPTDSISVYTRAVFNVADVTQIHNLALGADYDDGYVAWLNGVEIFRSPEVADGVLAWNSPVGSHESSNRTNPNYAPVADVTAQALPLLVDGANVLAVAVWNTTDTSSDLVIVPQLTLNRRPRLVRRPYLQSGGPHAITVCWRTDSFVAGRVYYGTDPENLDQVAGHDDLQRNHEVRITGLASATKYYYAVGSPDQVLAGGDVSHFFLTAPLPGQPRPTRVWVLGDSGAGNDAALRVRDAYYEYNNPRPTDVWLMLGDNAYEDGTDQEYQTNLFDVFQSTLRNTVLWPTLGNHDAASADSATQSGVYYDIFALPTSAESGGMASGTEAYYSFDYANIHFVVLDSHDSDRSPTGPMMTWLAADLAANTQDWTIAYWHHPPYSKGSHDSDTERRLIDMRLNALPVLEDYGVDLVLSGHSHSYERSFLLDGHYGPSTSLTDEMILDPGDGREGSDGFYNKPDLGPEPHQGAVYAVAGASSRLSAGVLDHPAMVVGFNRLGSMVIDVVGNRLDGRFLAATGEILDEFTLVKGPVTPIADFTADVTMGPAPLSVDFQDTSRHHPTQWSWDFQDNGSVDSFLASPFYTYQDPGIYSVRMLAANTAGADVLVAESLICVHEDQPPRVSGVAFDGSKIGLSWEPPSEALSYDLVRGDLMLSRSAERLTGMSCLAEDVNAPFASDPTVPASGEATFYLVRATSCASVTGSFDSDGVGQAAPRDPGLQGTESVCSCDPADDSDADSICRFFDNCPSTFNPEQLDADRDGIGDECDACTDTDADGFGDPDFFASACPLDNCPDLPNADQSNLDGDALGDPCDPCRADAANDLDADGICGDLDNCPETSNAAQADADGDGVGDACDGCSADPGNDADGDGVCSDVDNCPAVWNPEQADRDLDLTGDVCDTCTDTDGDGFGDPGFASGTCFVDNCPMEANPDQSDADGDRVGDACDPCPADADNDADGDGVCGNVDSCPATANPTQSDADGDGIGDACDACTDTDGDGFGDPFLPGSTCPPDNCPVQNNPDQRDTDLDGIGDLCDACVDDAANDVDDDGICANLDNCPTTANVDQVDSDGDGIGDACDPCPADADNDVDGDGACGDVDNCPDLANADQSDVDHDGIGDRCDACSDADRDGFGDPGLPASRCPLDNCPAVANPDQADLDGDHLGDACDTCTDTDGDGFGDPDFPANQCALDNCPATVNALQQDIDGDGTGDACDRCSDQDGDGFGDPDFPSNECPVDNCPAVSNLGQSDVDGDGQGDACDTCTDADGDGFGDPGFDANVCADDNCPVVSNLGQSDVDGDGQGDACDTCTDADGDGFGDPGFDANVCADDNCPAVSNLGQSDVDGDGQGDACDTCTDADGDGFGDPGYEANSCDPDNCPVAANADQSDSDGDGEGDACDVCPSDPANDADDDGACGDVDNCPALANPSQDDADGDGAGNVCDPCPADADDDLDRDGFCADDDNCPSVSNPSQLDGDGDGLGDVCDPCPSDPTNEPGC